MLTKEEKQQVEILIGQSLATLLSNLRNKIATIRQVEDAMVNFIRICDLNHLTDHRKIWNASAVLNKFSLELSLHLKCILSEEMEDDRKQHVKFAVVTIYESFKGIQSVLGKEFRAVVEKLPNGIVLLKDLTAVIKRLNEFKLEYADDFRRIRNTIAAHRDEDILVQLQTLLMIDLVEFLVNMVNYGKILNDLGPKMQSILNEANDNFHHLT